MQGNEGGADAQRAQFRQQRVIEVQARRRRGDRAPLAGKHRLVTRLVGGLRGAFDVGRQGQASVALDLLQGVAEKAQSVELALAADNLDLDRVFQAQPRTGFG